MSMDEDSRKILADLVRTRRVAALGTVRDGSPFVSMVLFAASPDYSSFYIHISRLALHTQAVLQDPRAALMIAEADCDTPDPQTLPRVSMQGTVLAVQATDPDHDEIKALYLAKCPQSAFNFELGDFMMFRFRASSARYVAGFGKIFDLTAEELEQAARRAAHPFSP
jgi:putative heme iron utilization protein